MRLIARLFAFISSLFILLYGVLPGLFKPAGNFVTTFVAGRNFLNGAHSVDFYKFPHFCRLVDLGGFSDKIYSFVSTTPSSILVAAALAIPPAPLARFLLTAVNIVAIIMLAHVTAKVAKAPIRTTYLVFLGSSYALATNFQLGEVFIIPTLLFVLALYSFSMNHEAMSGAFLGLAFPFSLFVAIPATLFLLTARWRNFAYFVASTLAVLLLTYIVVGQSTLGYYFQRILPAYIDGRVLNPFSDSYQTAWSFFRKLFVYNETLNTHPALESATAYLVASSIFKASVIVPPAYFFHKGISLKDSRHMLMAATFPIIFLSPTASSPQLIILAPAIVAMIQSAFEVGQRKTAAGFAVLYALACLPISSLANEYLKISNLFVDYERFILLLMIYALYLVFQRRIVPPQLRTLRLALTVIIVAAVSVTFYVGDRFVQHPMSAPLRPALTGSALKDIAFSPGMRSGRLSYIGYDSSAAFLTPHGITLKDFSGNYYRYSSDQAGRNYSVETVKDGVEIAYFKTRGAKAEFVGHDVSVSSDGDYGAFMRNATIYLLDLDPRYISPVDTLSLLPYRIRECSFNAQKNNEIVFLIDSLNSSCAIGTYNLFDHEITTQAAPFHVSLLCADGDVFYATQEVADTTNLWELRPETHPTKLLAINGNIYDISVLNRALFLSSDFRRGLEYPTVYEYVNEAGHSPGK